MSVGKERVYDQELIYARVIGLLASSRDIFCSCEGGDICKNPLTQNQSDDAGTFENAIEDINDIREG